MEPGRPRPVKQPDQTIYEMSWPSCVVAGIVDPGSSHVAMGTTIALSAAAHWGVMNPGALPQAQD